MAGFGMGMMIGAIAVGLWGVTLGPEFLVATGIILFLVGATCVTFGPVRGED